MTYNIDLRDPQWAYFFGFTQADGHLWQGPGNKGKLTIELQISDKPLLCAFQKLIPFYSSVSTRCRDTNFKQGYESCSLRVSNWHFRKELQRLGLPAGKKSTSVKTPETPFSASDYFRGWLDADGSVGITGKGFPFVSFGTKSPHIAAAFMSFCQAITGKPRKLQPNKRDNMFNIMYLKEDAQSLVQAFYYPGALALERKQKASATVLLWQRPPEMRQRPPYKRWTPEEDAVVWAELPYVAAQRLGRTEKSVTARAWRLKHQVGSSVVPLE